MDESSLQANKALIITRIEYMILNLYTNPDNIFKSICQLIDEHKLAEMDDTVKYFYEMLFFRGYVEYAQEFAEKYAIQTLNK